ncbi:Fe-S cluster assembly protein SufB, partial [archaeon]|nr:Fe-S cluster assembly protein SufB [archaeon]
MSTQADDIDIGEEYKEKYGFSDDIKYLHTTKPGINEGVVREISKIKNEPEWMLNFRLKGLKHFQERPMPKWGANLGQIDFDNITYYMSPSEKSETSWEDVPEGIRKTFDRLGIPEAEKKFLGGVGAQYESEVVYHSLRKDL